MRDVSPNRIMRTIWPVLSLLLILLGVYLFGQYQSLVFQREVTQMMINVILVVGLYVFAGNSGVLSFGQMSFMGLGAYATAILTIPLIQKQILLPDLPGFLANVHLGTFTGLIAAGLFAALIAMIIAFPIVQGEPPLGIAGDVCGAGDRSRGGQQLGCGHPRQPHDDRRADQHDRE